MPRAGRMMTIRSCLPLASAPLSLVTVLALAPNALSLPPGRTRAAQSRRERAAQARRASPRRRCATAARTRSGAALAGTAALTGTTHTGRRLTAIGAARARVTSARASARRTGRTPPHPSAGKRCSRQHRPPKPEHRTSGWGPVSGQPLAAAGAAQAVAGAPPAAPGQTGEPSTQSDESPVSPGSPSSPESSAPPESPSAAEPPVGEEGGVTEPPVGEEGGVTTAASRFHFFSPSSFWNQPLAANAPIDPSSAALVAEFDAEISSELQAGTGPWINTTEYSVPLYTVGANQATVPVALEESIEPALAASWSAVPLPSDAQPAAGTDKNLVVWQPSTDRMWEFWRLSQGADGWGARWGGSMQHVSENPGVYGPEAWLGAEPWWGASATSLALVGGLMTFHDLKHGSIEHALAIAIPSPRADVYALPAQRDDGDSANPLALPEGAHLRLNPELDLAALHLPPLTLMIAQAAQRYGIIVRDQASNVAFFAQAPAPPQANPYTGASGYFEGRYPDQLLASFPWSQLQVLQVTLREGS